MRIRSLLATLAAAAALSLVLPISAEAARPTTTDLAVTAYDSAATRTAGSYQFGGLTTGAPFGGSSSSSSVTAVDGTLPPADTCEAAVITVRTGSAQEYLEVTAAGEVCATFYGEGYRARAAFRGRDVVHVGTEVDRVRGSGTVDASFGTLLPTTGQLSLSGSLAW